MYSHRYLQGVPSMLVSHPPASFPFQLESVTLISEEEGALTLPSSFAPFVKLGNSCSPGQQRGLNYKIQCSTFSSAPEQPVYRSFGGVGTDEGNVRISPETLEPCRCLSRHGGGDRRKTVHLLRESRSRERRTRRAWIFLGCSGCVCDGGGVLFRTSTFNICKK